MALIGELSDLSLGELIEFFCNQRKTGRLKVVYPIGPGLFYLKSGAVVHAEFGELRGIDAVYYALTQPNASFTFNAAFEPPEQTINQPWTSVVLEGLRRMDQGIAPPNPFPNGKPENHAEKAPVVAVASVEAPKEVARPKVSIPKASPLPAPAPAPAPAPDFHAYGVLSSHADKFQSKRWSTPAVVGAIALLIAVVGVPWGWYARSKARQQVTTPDKVVENPVVSPAPAASESPAPTVASDPNSNTSTTEAQAAAKRQADAREKEKEKERARQKEQQANSQAATETPKPTKQNNGAKSVTVTVTYDENGRVTGASGGDATALRIARQKRFPAGKPGSATVTIPIN